MIVTCVHDTHVIVDSKGEAILSGSESEMRNYAESARALGCQCHVEQIAPHEQEQKWAWEKMDWGD
jgi:hypothetical protein